jgi:hypothetical protein
VVATAYFGGYSSKTVGSYVSSYILIYRSYFFLRHDIQFILLKRKEKKKLSDEGAR